MRRPAGLVSAALLALLLLLLDSSTRGALAAPNNGSAALAKAASEMEVLPTPEDPRDADGEDDDSIRFSLFFPLCRAGHWTETAMGIESRIGIFLGSMAPTAIREPH